jgi:hypothetical protein
MRGGRGVEKGRLLVLVGGDSFQNVNLITTNQNQEQKLTKIFKLKQVRFQTKTKAVACGGAAARDAPHCC